MSDQPVTITFLPSKDTVQAKVTVQVPEGTRLLEAARQAGIQVNSVCGGKGSCGKCKGRLLSGSLGSRSREPEPGRRRPAGLPGDLDLILLCQSYAIEDVTIEVLSADQAGTNFAPGKGELSAQMHSLNPAVHKKFLELTPPSIQDQKADVERILDALPEVWDLDLGLIAVIPKVLREGDYKVTAVVIHDQLVSVEAGDTTRERFGISVDIGTTSVAAYLVDLFDGRVLKTASATNRQRSYGADVISRIAYSVEAPEGQARLKQVILETIDSLIERLLPDTGVKREHLYYLTFIGNTVMSHLLLGVSAAGVASAPFVPAFSRKIEGKAAELGLRSVPPYTRFALLPNVAGYVGSDTVGVMLATKIADLTGNWLAVDIGTNGEIVLGSGGRLLTCSTAAGPAFEGASISQGMRAEPGAIYRVDLEDEISLGVVNDQRASGICGSGLIDCVSEMYRLGMLRANGRLKGPDECPDVPAKIRERLKPDGQGWKFVLVEGANEGGQEVALTQKDISELQLGKGAVRAGVEILMESLNIMPEQLDGILLAGAFGSNLRPESILGIGMLPPVDLAKIKSIGNAAGTGAVLALLSEEVMKEAQGLPQRVHHIELSLYEGFSRKFAKALRF